MAHWVDTYPHDVYASVLLLDGKIYNWKIGNRYWESPFHVKMRYADFDKIDRMEVHHTSFTVNNSTEHSYAFEVLSRKWFKQWDIHEDRLGAPPYDENVKMHLYEIKVTHVAPKDHLVSTDEFVIAKSHMDVFNHLYKEHWKDYYWDKETIEAVLEGQGEDALGNDWGDAYYGVTERNWVLFKEDLTKEQIRTLVDLGVATIV
ncbi:hypothetical protein [Bacillus phage vB_BanS-Thrax3]|nr:hypothetical protein [Bacillus phage vB_BanS-Thrax1]UUV46552.1 hypothetical protein [Bacillus phage vB_BanS-Thrax3]